MMTMATARTGGWIACAACLLAVAPAARAGEVFDPPRLLRGAAPRLDPRSVGGGLVLLDVGVNDEGSVADLRTLVPADPYTQALRRAVEQFRFRPARAGDEAREARVLVAGLFRPPSLHAVGSFDAPPPSPEVLVAWPIAIMPPVYPVTARGDATVIVALRLDHEGLPVSAAVIEGAPGFDAAAVAAARVWRFSVPGSQAASAVIAFVFREPADHGPPPR